MGASPVQASKAKVGLMGFRIAPSRRTSPRRMLESIVNQSIDCENPGEPAKKPGGV